MVRASDEPSDSEPRSALTRVYEVVMMIGGWCGGSGSLRMSGSVRPGCGSPGGSGGVGSGGGVSGAGI